MRARFPEIQALRFVAVAGVLLYHLWPNRLPGGYAGVDVFFVISGFLITAHLSREWTTTGRIRLGRFYARRARRLLPAALLVLTVTAVASWVLLPVRVREQVFHEVTGAAIYVENWVLAASSVDYLAQSTDVASPVQHYWSLSVEEQFYLVWPVLMILAGWLSTLVLRRRGRRSAGGPSTARPAFVVALSVVFVVCLVLSVVQTQHDPGPAYFATQTRAWEFAAGGLLALVLRRSERSAHLRAVGSWVGFATIAGSFLLFTAALPFPGWIAVVPVVGALLVIACGDPETPDAPGMLYRWRPVQWAGDVSYSLYLWHWPLVVLVPAATGTALGTRAKVAILVASVLLAAVTKVVVEDPVRSRPFLADRPARWTVVAVAASLVPVLVVSTVASADAGRRIDAERAAAAAFLARGDECVGAAAVVGTDCPTTPATSVLLPGLDAAQTDDVNTPACWSRNTESAVKVCGHGPAPDAAALTVALIGDSHSNQYLAALERLADEAHWHVDVYGKSGCAWTSAVQEDAPDWVSRCESWKRSLQGELAVRKPYDVILTSYQRQSPFVEPERGTREQSIVDGFVDTWSRQTARGTKVVAIRDNPGTRDDYLTCVERHLDTDPGAACAVPRTDALGTTDAQVAAVRAVRGASLLDLTDLMCGPEACEPVVGNVVVYRDPRHLTSTFTRSLAPMIRQGVLHETGLTERR
ncbi:acyltransferase family protein [Curtobacterium sp. L1-20]|uniref:acyltransferase family protein n=1 Tax=Curtobacterium sp. L1-20 TaxID=3138181 RepID=UPI003B51E2A4